VFYSRKHRCQKCRRHCARRMDHPLIAAVKRGDVAEVIRARDACGDLGVVRSPNTENTALHIAAAIGDVAVLKALLPDFKWRPGARDVPSGSAWHVDARNKNRDTPLMHALARAQVDAATALLDAGARLDVVNDARSTPLHLAASSGHAECVLLVLARRSKKNNPEFFNGDVSIDEPDKLGRTALHYAACVDAGCVARLLEAGANPFARESKGNVPASVAEREGHPEPARLLRDAMRAAESRAAEAAAALAGEGEEELVSGGGEAKKSKKKKRKGGSTEEKHEERRDDLIEKGDVGLTVASGWSNVFAESDRTETETETGTETADPAIARNLPPEAPPDGFQKDFTKPGTVTEQIESGTLHVMTDPADRLIPTPSSTGRTEARSWVAATTRDVSRSRPVAERKAVARSPDVSPVSESRDGASETASEDSDASKQSWEAQAKSRLAMKHPAARALKVRLRNLLGVGVGELSASQLEAAEDVHRELIGCLVDARVELARKQERARLEEEAAIERTIATLAASGMR